MPSNPTSPHSAKSLAFVVGALALLASGAALAGPCTGLGAPITTQTKCLTAIQIPGNPLRSFDISWVNPDRAEYYLGDRSNAGIDVIDTRHDKFKYTIGGFVGVVLLKGAVDNNHSGPDGVVSHGRWLYAGDGDSTLKVIDLDAPLKPTIEQSISTGGSTRVDEMALTTDGKLLLVANNAEDPPFGTLFNANGDNNTSNVTKISKITVASTIIPTGSGLSLEQPTWDPKTERFYVSIPIIAGNPTGCTLTPLTCHGGMLVIDPTKPVPVGGYGLFDAASNTPQNNPSDTSTLVINAKTKNFANIGNITGSDEVWFNAGDNRYYTGSSRFNGLVPGVVCPDTATPSCPVLGVINGETNLLIETVPQGSGSHSVAADSRRNRIYVPQVGTVLVVGTGGDTTNTGVSAGICGGSNGCIAVYEHDVDHEHEEADNEFDRDHRSDQDR